jgi:hypothetical protein
LRIDATPGQGLTCGHCGSGYQRGDQFCQRCGAPVPPSHGGADNDGRPSPQTQSSPPAADDRGPDGPTRYLCAAAHLDQTFANAAIGEYLVERTRAVPPSPGVDSVAVLRDAVAARYRRRVRDAVLLVLALLFVIADPTLALLWLVVGTVLYVTTGATKHANRAVTTVTLVLAGVALVVAVSLVASFGASFNQSTDSGGTVAALLLGLLILGVLLADELIITELTRSRFLPGRFTPDPAKRPGWEQTVRTLGHANFADQLKRVADADRRGTAPDQTEVIVYRGWRPFLGAGVPLRNRGYAVPLKPAKDDGDDAGDPRTFTALELQNHLRDALGALRDSQSLSPSRRLRNLTIREEVFVSAERLVRNRTAPYLSDVLVDLNRPPASHLPSRVARQLADSPREAARYFQCFRVETWDRDLTISCYVAIGTDNRTLYLEWTHCALFPVHQRYRGIDLPDETGPVRRALLLAVVFPVSLRARLGNVMHWFTPIRERGGVVVPARYGASFSLRELAANDQAHEYFQDADKLRYLEVVEQALFRAIGEFLKAHDYSVRDVLDIAKHNISQSNINITNSTLSNSSVAGRDSSPGSGGAGSTSREGT